MRKSAMFFLAFLLFWAFFFPPVNSFAQVIKKASPFLRSEKATIASIVPNAVCLQQGGAEAIATVEGKYLETIRSATAIKNGSGVGAITVKLVQPWPESKKIEFQAATNAPVAQGYQLRFNGRADFKGFRIDVPLSLFSLEVAKKKQSQLKKIVTLPRTLPRPHEEGLGMPDLVITDDAWEQDSLKNFLFTAKLRNSGSKGVSFQTNQVMAKIVAPGKSFEIKAPGGGIFIASNSGTDLSMIFTVDPALLSFTVTWTANPNRIVAESNYLNNEKASQIVPPLPDLVISELKVNQLPGFKFDDQHLEFTINVTNNGNAVAATKGGTYGTDLSALMDGKNWNYEINPQYIPNLNPGASMILKLRPKSPLDPLSTHIIKVWVDGNKTVTEQREDNNDATLSFTLPVNVESIPPLPDLVVSQITVNPTSGTPSTVFEFTITVANQGAVAAPANASQLCQVMLDGNYGSWENVVNSGYRILNPGESMVVTKMCNKNPLPPGTHTFKATVDAYWFLKEENEANNDKTVYFTVTM
jgi:hypothetical protein